MSTPKTDWQRARHPEQIEERRQAILEAASALLGSEGLDGTGINAIAREAGISKANIYRYFESREAILLQLLLDEHQRWLDSLQGRLEDLAGSQDVAALSGAIADTLTARPLFCHLVGSLATVLEQNVGPDTVRTFKREILAAAGPTIEALHRAHEGLIPEKGRQFLVLLSMTASGIWPHCHPAPAVEEVLAEEEFAHFRFDFRDTVAFEAASILANLLRS